MVLMAYGLGLTFVDIGNFDGYVCSDASVDASNREKSIFIEKIFFLLEKRKYVIIFLHKHIISIIFDSLSTTRPRRGRRP